MRPKGVADGQRVDIPVPPDSVMSNGVTQKGRSALSWFSGFKLVGGESRQIRSHLTLRSDDDLPKGREVTDPTLPRKTSSQEFWCPYPKPTQVDR